MVISEAQLATWSKQGPTGQFTATYETLKSVLTDGQSPYSGRDYTIFLQGSYKNDTNTYGESDVDICIRLNEVFFTDLGQLSDEDKIAWNAARSDATYTLPQFKMEVTAWLAKKYGNDLKVGAKALYIKGNGTRRDADILVCAMLRRYHRFKSWLDQNYTEGICFFKVDGTRIDNFPILHSANCTTKHQDTKSWFKHTARVYKNLRNVLVEKKLIADGLAPSYFLEGLLYNVPKDRFGGTEVQNFCDTINWLNAADRSKFLCANEMFYLFHDTSPVTWRAQNCSAFLRVAIDYYNAG
ncbi:MAG: nucleotidyltransferase [Pseudomonadota bacterium]